jgi:hypothetical protein
MEKTWNHQQMLVKTMEKAMEKTEEIQQRLCKAMVSELFSDSSRFAAGRLFAGGTTFASLAVPSRAG